MVWVYLIERHGQKWKPKIFGGTQKKNKPKQKQKSFGYTKEQVPEHN